MVDVTPLVKQGSQIIQAYSDGFFKISAQRYDGAVLVDAAQTRTWDGAERFEGLTLDHFRELIERKNEIDVVLLGTGAQIKLLSPEFRLELKNAGLAVEAMDTGAACRTYNVLMAEGRRVVAALLPSA